MSASPYMADDGTHVFPVSAAWHASDSKDAVWFGEVCWSLRDGLTYSLEKTVDWWDLAGLSAQLHKPSAGGAGRMVPSDSNLDWTARLSDGTELQLIGVIQDESSQQKNVNGGMTAKRFAKGQATHCIVSVPRESPLAFWHDTPPYARFFLFGLDVLIWPLSEEITYEIGNTQHTTSRRLFRLADDLNVYATLDGRPKDLGAWITGPDGADSAFEYDARFDQARTLTSLLSGRLTPFYWHDAFTTSDRLTRTYYGWRREAASRSPGRSVVPIESHNVDTLRHHQSVFEHLPGAYARLRQRVPDYNFDWILSPLWHGYDSYLEDRLAVACVALERLATAHRDYTRKVPIGPAAKTTLISAEQMDEVKKRVVPTLKAVATELGISTDDAELMVKRLGNLHQVTNTDKLTKVFTDYDIPITAFEEETINNRNRCLHGGTLLKNVNDLQQVEAEVLRFDTIRTLLHRGVLAILEYDGPYIDYSERPNEGNFPIKSLPPRKCSTLAPIGEI